MLNLYEGLRQSNLTNFDVLLTGYVPSAEAVQAIGKIGRDVKFNAGTKPGSFFWGEYRDTAGVLGRADHGQCWTQ
jgi:pyridoxine kinase